MVCRLQPFPHQTKYGITQKWACNAQITNSHFKMNALLWQQDAADLWVNPKLGLQFYT